MKTNIIIDKDHSHISYKEAVDWTIKNCSYNDVRKRLRSRAVAWTLLHRINELETKLTLLESSNGISGI